MRRYGVLIGSAMALLAFGLVAGQAQVGGGRGGGGRGFGGFGNDPLALLRRGDVKKELELTEDQTEKLPAAVMKALAEVLDAQQMKRFRQIELQVRGMAAFRDDKVRKQLKISDSQAKNLDDILEDSRKEITELFKDAKKGGKGMREKMDGINKETREKVMAVLSADQRKTYKHLIGPEFKLEQMRFPGFNKKDGK